MLTLEFAKHTQTSLPYNPTIHHGYLFTCQLTHLSRNPADSNIIFIPLEGSSWRAYTVVIKEFFTLGLGGEVSSVKTGLLNNSIITVKLEKQLKVCVDRKNVN